MIRHMLAATTVMALLFLLTLGAPHASADVVTLQLTSDHCTGGCLSTGQTSAGTITITDISGGVTVTVALISGDKFMGQGGQGGDFGFNLIGNPTIAGSASPNDYTLNSTSAGSIHLDGTGNFEYAFSATFPNGAGNAKTGPYTFTITGSGVTSSSFETNGSGQYFAVDILGANGNTGFVDASTRTNVVPDGGMTLMLLGGALVGLESLRRKFRV